jgi:hypothetical protein
MGLLGARGCMYCEGDVCTKECIEDIHSPLHEFTQKKLMGVHNPVVREHISNGIRYGSEWERSRLFTKEDMLKAVKFGELYQTEGSKSLFEKRGTTPSEVLNKWLDSFKKK